MAEMTVAFFIATAVLVMIVVPFTVFYYEGEEVGDGTAKVSQVVYALKWLVPCMLLEALAIGLCWYFVGTAEVAVTVLTGTMSQTTDYFNPTVCYNGNAMLVRILIVTRLISNSAQLQEMFKR